MKTLTFFKTAFRVTEKEQEVLRLTYNEPFLEFTEQPYFHATGVCCPNLNSVLLYIENTESLSIRLTSLQERIAKGLTPSRAMYRNWVEEGLVNDLLEDAERMYRNEIGEPVGRYLGGEVKEFFKLPNDRGQLRYAIEQQEKVREISEPIKRLDNLPIYYNGIKGDNSNYQCWGVYVKNSQYSLQNGCTNRTAKATGTNIGKIGIFNVGYNSDKGNYIQIYLYDYAGRDWAFQTVLQYLIENEGLKLDYSKV